MENGSSSSILSLLTQFGQLAMFTLCPYTSGAGSVTKDEIENHGEESQQGRANRRDETVLDACMGFLVRLGPLEQLFDPFIESDKKLVVSRLML